MEALPRQVPGAGSSQSIEKALSLYFTFVFCF